MRFAPTWTDRYVEIAVLVMEWIGEVAQTDGVGWV
jgi:hypothetical protein